MAKTHGTQTGADTAAAAGAMKDWKHPTGCVPESVMIVALGPTKNDLLDLTTGHEPPELVMDCDEVWGINAGANQLGGRVAYDVLWVMDYLDGEARRLPRYAELLTRWAERHGSPIITSRGGLFGAYREYVREYPLKSVLAAVGTDNAYFHNSLPYVLAYAYAIGVRRIVLWGADYTHERSKRREEDRANAEYWVGYLRAKGMEIWLPSTTTLCSVSRQPYWYGYPPHEQPDLAALFPGEEVA